MFLTGTTAVAAAGLQVETTRADRGILVAFDASAIVIESSSGSDWAPSYTFDGTFDSSTWSGIQSASYHQTSRYTENASSFSLYSAYRSSAQLNGPQGINGVQFTGTMLTEHTITVTEDSLLRLTFDFVAPPESMQAPLFRNSSLVEVSSSSGAFVSLAAGFGRTDGAAAIQEPFSFDVAVSAGETISVAWQTGLRTYNARSSASTESWDIDTWTEFRIDVVPAPSSAAVLAGAGLFASRRRRR